MSNYWKLWAALLAAGILAAWNTFAVALDDGHVSGKEWVAIIGLVLGPILVASAPKNTEPE